MTTISSEGIILTPQHWKQPYAMAYTHTAPDGTCWNVDFVSDVIVHVWTINAWGVVFEEDIPKADFIAKWKQQERKPMFEEYDNYRVFKA